MLTWNFTISSKITQVLPHFISQVLLSVLHDDGTLPSFYRFDFSERYTDTYLQRN